MIVIRDFDDRVSLPLEDLHNRNVFNSDTSEDHRMTTIFVRSSIDGDP